MSATAGQSFGETEASLGGGSGAAGGGTSGAGNGGNYFNEDLTGVVRLYGNFVNRDLVSELQVATPARARDLEAMLDRAGGQSGFDVVADQLGSLPTGELEPVGLAGPSGRAKAEALRRAIGDARDGASGDGSESRYRRVLRWGKYFWGSLKTVLGIFFPQLKNLMDAIDELLDYADNALAEVEGGWI